MKNVFIIIGALALMAFKNPKNKKEEKEEMISIIQTADIHAYLNTHTELFVEDGSIVFREAGGLAQIKTLVEYPEREPRRHAVR